jgi:hypothetical protein
MGWRSQTDLCEGLRLAYDDFLKQRIKNEAWFNKSGLLE